jgi:gliding motility-associated-like protein
MEIPKVSISGNLNLCLGSSTVLQAAGSGFTRLLWSTGETTANIKITQPGTYSVKAFTAAGCFSENSLVVKSISPVPVTISGDNKICFGSTTRLRTNATGVSKYVWSTGETTPNIEVKSSGTYAVKAFTNDQCFTEAAIVVEVMPGTILEKVEVAGVSICPNNQATLAPTNPAGLFQWYDAESGGNLISEGNSFTTPVLVKTTSYYVQVKNNNACSTAPRTPVTVLVGSNLTANAGRDTTITTGSTIVLRGQGGGRYHWEPATGLNNPEVERPVAKPTKTTTYQLTTYKDGCEAKAEVTITVLPSITLVNTFSPNQDGANDLWEIPQIENYPGATVQIFNRWGAVIYKADDGYKKPWDGTYQGKVLPLATYYYIIRLNKTTAPLSGSITLIR